MLKYFLILPCFLTLCGCNTWVSEEPSLTSKNLETKLTSDCASCHTYPVGGKNHDFHLFNEDANNTSAGAITCMDCHSSAIQHYNEIVFDSLYADTLGNQYNTYQLGKNSPVREWIKSGQVKLTKVDTITFHRPIKAPIVPGHQTIVQEWLTGIDHLNGKVDVKFDSRVTDTTMFKGKFSIYKATYNPEEETCSAIACHGNEHVTYRFANNSKGLSKLPN